MKVELSHVGDDGGYIVVRSQESIEFEHLVLGSYTLSSITVRDPEASSLDISITTPTATAKWSGLYQTGRVDLGFMLNKGDRIRFKATNVGYGEVLVRMDAVFKPGWP